MPLPYPMTRLQFSLALAILGAVACNGTIGDSIGLGSTGTGNPVGGGPTGGLTSGAGGPVGAGGGPGSGGSTMGPDRLADPAGLGFVAMLRLSKREYQQSIVDLLAIPPPTSLGALPEDIAAPFDNDYASQVASAPLISGLSTSLVMRRASSGPRGLRSN